MTGIMVHGFHRLSHFLSGQKVTKEPPEPTASGPPSIHPRFLEGFRHPCPLDWQLYEAFDGNRRFTSV